MTKYSNNYNNLLFDFEALPVESLSLEPEQIEQAIELSNQIVNEQKQWNIYINALALFAFESWLHSRAPELMINSDSCPIWQPSYTNIIDGVFNLEVGEFKVCLLARGTMGDKLVSIPRAVVDLPEYTAHFYVLINVQEEQEEATVESFIPYNQLQEKIQSANLQPQPDWTYDLSWSWFNREPDNLLLYLRCLEVSAITLPALASQRLTNLENIQAELESLLPQLQNSETPLWQILSWETAVTLLTSPELLDWLYQLQTGTISAAQKATAPTRQLTQTSRRLAQGVINVGLWLQNELDEFSQTLAWTLLPAPTFAYSSLRSVTQKNRASPAEELAAVITQLRDSAIDVPVAACGAYQDFRLGTNPLRLYAITWAIAEPENIPEWTLLIVLGAQPEHQLPQGLRLQLKEGNTLLDEKIVAQDSDDTYLYTRVIGGRDEQFGVTIILNNGETLVLPTFSFVNEQ